MYVFPASHLKVHAAFEPGRAGEQKHLPVFILLLAASVFLLVVSDFSSYRGVPMRTQWPERQCCQGAEISATKHLEFLPKISTGITIKGFT
jgi:hypothetical protein